MVVGADKSRGPVVRLDCGYGQKKIDVTTDILYQWRASSPKKSIPLDSATTKQVLPQGQFKIVNNHPHPTL